MVTLLLDTADGKRNPGSDVVGREIEGLEGLAAAEAVARGVGGVVTRDAEYLSVAALHCEKGAGAIDVSNHVLLRKK